MRQTTRAAGGWVATLARFGYATKGVVYVIRCFVQALLDPENKGTDAKGMRLTPLHAGAHPAWQVYPQM